LLIRVAQDFTPRYELIGPLVVLDLSGLSRLFGSAREIGEQLRTSMGPMPVRVAIAASQTAAALLALGRPGLTVVSAEEQPMALARLQVSLLGELEKTRSFVATARVERRRRGIVPPHVAAMEDVLPYFQSCLNRTSAAARAPHVSASARVASDASFGETSPERPSGRVGGHCGGGWTHPRDAHAAKFAKHARTAPVAPHAPSAPAAPAVDDLLSVLRRWGVKTLGALAALPAGEVYERLGARGVAWQRLARGDDQSPLVPCVPEDPFEGTLDLEWPIEGLEPLSFVLARLFEPLSERLERADRGAAILHTHLRLTTREVYARTVQLPAPMREAKTLRTLALLDLEANPPSAAIDRVRVLIEPTPARVLQWTLYDRAQPSPEQVSTVLARLTALMGEGHVGSPALVNSWKPGAFEMKAFAPAAPIAPIAPAAPNGPAAPNTPAAPGVAIRKFRLPIPARVQMQDGRPVRVMVERRGVAGGGVKESAGPWRTSGEWWNDGQVSDPPHQPHPPYRTDWDRDEWDVVLNGGEAYRIYVERDVGQWFVDGVID
jgi:protein ImuB